MLISRVRVAKPAARRISICAVVLVLMLFRSAAGSGQESSADAKPAAPRERYTVYESERGPLLLGEVTRLDILTQFPTWTESYGSYELDQVALYRLDEIAWPVEIVCVLGTWCSDSEREVPRFWKMLDALKNENFTLQMLAVGRHADSTATALLADLGFAEDIRAGYDIEFVPTFIFLQYGVEVGRIIETPRKSLESDTAAILFGDQKAEDSPQWH
jgi:hypothetical protein